MPVPVSSSQSLPAHPVYKPHSGLALTSLNRVVPSGHPPSLGCGESPSVLKHNRPRRIWEEEENFPAEQSFPSGLAFTANVSAIKGIRAEARPPPLGPLFPAMHHHDTGCLSAAEPVHHASHVAPYEPGPFSPVYDEESPDVDVSSSPIEPVTPFGLFVDRAISSHEPAVAVHTDASQYMDEDSEWQHGQAVAAELHDAKSCQQGNIASEEPVPAPEVVTPSASPEYRRLAEYYSDWIAKFVWRICTTGMAMPESYSPPSASSLAQFADTPPDYLAGAIYSLLLSTLLEPSAILLALWYIARLPVFFAAPPLVMKDREALFRLELLGEGTEPDTEAMQITAPFRLVVLGFMLSNKWLSDHTYSNKTWHAVSNVPLASLNTLESVALSIYGYDLSVSNPDWTRWLSFVMSYHARQATHTYPQPISRPSSSPHGLIRKSIEELCEAVSSQEKQVGLPQPIFTGLEERRKDQLVKEQAAQDTHEIDLDEDGPLRSEYLPRRRADGEATYQASQPLSSSINHNVGALCGGKPLPPPAKWSPAADEPILRESQRVNGHSMNTAGVYPVYPAYHSLPFEQTRELCSNQNWPIGAYNVPMKQVAAPAYGLDASQHHLHPSAYNQISLVQSLAMSHSRSHSLSYGQENNTLSRNHLRCFSQTGHDTRCNGDLTQHSSFDHMWGPGRQHYAAAPVFAPVFNIAYQSSWLTN